MVLNFVSTSALSTQPPRAAGALACWLADSSLALAADQFLLWHLLCLLHFDVCADPCTCTCIAWCRAYVARLQRCWVCTRGGQLPRGRSWGASRGSSAPTYYSVAKGWQSNCRQAIGATWPLLPPSRLSRWVRADCSPADFTLPQAPVFLPYAPDSDSRDVVQPAVALSCHVTSRSAA
jgi:hypothetical protein